jgi:hypothetical protein
MTLNLLSPGLRLVVAAVVGLLAAPEAGAQSLELTPFGGYRFGWGVSDVGGAPVIDDDGGGSFGMIANIALSPRPDDFKFEALFSREQARVTIQPTYFSPPLSAMTTVDHMMIGVLQEIDPVPGAAASAFISALVGLTRYAAADEMEMRFSVGLGAGGRFFASRHLGLRLEARGYMTIVDLGGAGICSGGCAIALRANPAFQVDFTAGVIVAF